MNIFFLDTDPKVCAQYHCDKHVVKMILETAQILCSVHKVNKSRLQTPYKPTHLGHPCVQWASECIANYLWLVELGYALCEEYTLRYGKKHKSKRVIRWAKKNIPKFYSFETLLQPPALAITDELKLPSYTINDAVAQYRKYYKYKQDNGLIMRYTKQNIPTFL